MEKNTLTSEILALRESLASAENYYKESSELRDQEVEVLNQTSALLKQKEDYYLKLANDKIQTDKQLWDLWERDQTFSQNKQSEIIKNLEAETEKAYTNIEISWRQLES